MKARHILPFVILCSLFLSCKDDRPFEDAYLWQNNASLTASLTTLLFEADASTQTVAINTNSGYGITVDQTWLTVERSADNQTLTVSVQANTTSATRNATITINASGKSQTINVSQSGVSLNVSRSTLTLAANASSDTLKVTANGNYTYSSSDSWLTVTQSSDKTTLTVSATENTGKSDRTATITLTIGSLTENISVTQTTIKERVFTVTGNGKTVTFKMIEVEGGTFQMGSTIESSDAAPLHSVTISKSYYMGETEVTQALWYAVMGQSPTSNANYWYWDSQYGLGDEYPAYFISYEDCQSFISALNSKLSSQLGSGEQFRFPTEAEWEFAAKGGNKSQGYIYSGSNTIGDVAWYSALRSAHDGTHTVKTKSPNEIDLYDMTGNVDEWCYDWYGDYSSGAQTDPSGAFSGSGRVLRGGSWGTPLPDCNVNDRFSITPSYRSEYLGFRLCLGTPISEPEPSLSVSTTSLSFAAAASSKTLNVTANGEYTYSTSASWITITQSSDKTTLTVSASENTGTSERTATITLTLGSITETVSVTQAAAANTSDDDRIFTVTGNGKTVTFKMIKVQGGTFQMGSNDYDWTKPIHSVTLSKAYYMGETEVTQALWYAVMGYSPTSGGFQWSSTYGFGDEWPAYYISYADCQSFLTALNSKLSSQLSSGESFRFPTEAEWEFAAKGGNKSNGYTYSGSNTIGDVAWYWDNSNSTTHSVKTKSPNELGLYDMSGNVWEWCYDWYDYYSSGAQTDPTGPTSDSYRVLRGGSWNANAEYCRVANRGADEPTNRNYIIGFRLCLGTPIE